MTQNRSSPSIPGSPIHAQLRKYRHSPCTFWRIFLHIVALTPGRCSFSCSCLQSVIESVLLSNGSAHLGSESLLHSQHLMARTEILIHESFFSSVLTSHKNWTSIYLFAQRKLALQRQQLSGECYSPFQRSFRFGFGVLMGKLIENNKKMLQDTSILLAIEVCRLFVRNRSSRGLLENSKTWKLVI